MQVVCTFIDISIRKAAEQEVKIQNLELHKINAEKDKFFSIIAHDLKSPFHSFLGLTQILAEESMNLTTEEIRDMALCIRKSANNMYDLLETLLEWSLIQRGVTLYNPEPIRLRPRISDCLESIQELADKKGTEIRVDIPEDLMVHADPKMLESILRNLISNALKFTPKGGTVKISGKQTDDNTVEISVQDNGIGISEIMIGKLFRLDQQVSRRGTEGEPSTGLGLIICNDFVEKQGGKIRVQSEEGMGTVFTFTLPVPADS
jgi:signal transduction histidine kinase